MLEPPIVPIFVINNFRTNLSPAEKATSVLLPTHVIRVEVVFVNSTPSSKGPPNVSASAPPVYLYNLYLPPALALVPDSEAQIFMSVVVMVIPEESGWLIQATVEPPAVAVHWMFVPLAAVLTTAVVAPAPAVVERS